MDQTFGWNETNYLPRGKWVTMDFVMERVGLGENVTNLKRKLDG